MGTRRERQVRRRLAGRCRAAQGVQVAGDGGYAGTYSTRVTRASYSPLIELTFELERALAREWMCTYVPAIGLHA